MCSINNCTVHSLSRALSINLSIIDNSGMLRIKPRAAGWETQPLPLCYAATSNTHLFLGSASSRVDAKDPQVPGAGLDGGGVAPRAADQQAAWHLPLQGREVVWSGKGWVNDSWASSCRWLVGTIGPNYPSLLTLCPRSLVDLSLYVLASLQLWDMTFKKSQFY